MKIIKNLSVVLAFLCISLLMNAQTPWAIVENDGVKTISLNYWQYGSDVDYDGISDTWQGNNSAIFKESADDKYWIPQVGEQFSLTMNGTANFSGEVKIYLADVRAEVDYWGGLSKEYVSIEVQENEPFQIQKTFTISQVESDVLNSYAGTFLSEPSFVIMEIPTITSKSVDFDKKQILSLNLTQFECTYVKNESTKLFEISYNEYGFDNDADTISDTWQTAFPLELQAALNKAGVSTWKPQIGESFTLKAKGVANFSGKIGFYIVDQDVDPIYWTFLSTTDDNYQVEQGKEFTLEKKFIVTINEKNETPLNDVTFVIGCLPLKTSTQSGFDKERTYKLNFSDYSLEYNSAPTFAKIFKTDYETAGKDFDEDGKSDNWQSVFTEEILTALSNEEISDWKPKIDEKFHITMKGFANFSGNFDFYIADQRDEVGNWTLLSDSTQPIYVKAGELFEIEKEIIISSVEKDGVLLTQPDLILNCVPAIHSKSPGFDKTEQKTLYLTDYSIKYDSVYEVVKTFEFDYCIYGGDQDYDGISDTWRSVYRNELTDAVGSTSWKPQKGEIFPFHMKGLSNFTGIVYFMLADMRPEVDHWGQLNNVVPLFEVKEGELFEVTDTIRIEQIKNSQSVYMSYPELVIACMPNITSKNSNFDTSKKLKLSLGEYSFTYKNPAVIKKIEVLYDAEETDTDGDKISDTWRTSFSEELPSALKLAEINTWTPQVGDTYTITMRGTANYSGTVNFMISEQAPGENFKAVMIEIDEPIAVKSGDVFEIERTLLVTAVERNAETFINPSFEIICTPSVSSTNSSFNSEEKMILSLSEYSIQFKNADDYVKIFDVTYDESGTDRDSDKKSDTWQTVFEEEVASALNAQEITSWNPMAGEMFSIFANGISNFTGTVKLYVGKKDESGNVINACKEENSFYVTAGKEFKEELSFTLQGSEIENPQLIIVCEPKVCSKNAYFDAQLNKSLYLKEYYIVYTQDYDFVKIFDVDYSNYGYDSDNDGISDIWSTVYEDELDASWEIFDITDFHPVVGETFTIKAKGIANYSGTAAFSIIDNSPEIGFWADLCREYGTIEFKKGEVFDLEKTFVITQDNLNNVAAKYAKLGIICSPKITSTASSFSKNKKQRLSLLEYSVEYSGIAPELSAIKNRTLALNGKTYKLPLSKYCKSLDGAKLSYEVTSEDSEIASVSIQNDTVCITPGAIEGKTIVTIKAISSNGTNATRSFNVTVADIQEIQIIANIDDIEVEKGTDIPNIDLAQYFSIDEGISLTFDAVSSKEDVVFVSVIDNNLSILPNETGETEIVVYVTSSEGAVEEQRFLVTILKAEVPDFFNEYENDDIVVYSFNKTIFLKNAEEKTVSVYDLTGRRIHYFPQAEAELAIPICSNGIYIVQVNNQTYKVVVE